MMHILLDGDWILYTAGFAAQHTEYVARCDHGELFGPYENKTAMKEAMGDEEYVEFSRVYTDPLDHALHSAKKMIQSQVEKIVEKFEPDDFVDLRIFLDGKGNFREDIATIRPYKGNRVDKSKPILYPEIREYLELNYACDVSSGCESDDRLAMAQTFITSRGEESIIVGIDKDLLQVPGWHLNPNKGFKRISNAEGMGRLYRQAIQGDTVDNIAGAYKCGKQAAVKAIRPNMTEEQMWEAVVSAYDQSIEKYGSSTELYGGLTGREAAIENMRLVYLQRKPDEVWFPPEER